MRNWPKERGPTETLPGRKAETDRVCEGISEGFRLAESVRVAPRGPEANGSMAPLHFLADSERVTAKAQERLAMPSPSPYHLQLLLVPLQRLQHRHKNQPAIF